MGPPSKGLRWQVEISQINMESPQTSIYEFHFLLLLFFIYLFIFVSHLKSLYMNFISLIFCFSTRVLLETNLIYGQRFFIDRFVKYFLQPT
jgi:hypothetical protein